MSEAAIITLVIAAFGASAFVMIALVTRWIDEKRAADLDRRRPAGGTGVDTPTYPGSLLYGGHAAPATCHSHGDGGFSCSSDGGSDGGGGGGD